ncbi:MAG: AraC family transcriptional regulator [Cyanobacteria bacterium J06632_22]
MRKSSSDSTAAVSASSAQASPTQRASSGKSANRKPCVKLWQVPILDHMEVLRGDNICHAFTRHLHSEFGLGVVNQGRLAYETREEEYVLGPGDIVVINPGQVHWGGTVEKRPYSYRMIYPSAALMAQAMVAETGLPYFRAGKVCDRNLAQRLRYLIERLENDPINLVQESYFVSALTDLITRHAESISPPVTPSSQSVQQVRDYIEAFYSQNISLSELATLAGMKPLRLLRSFRKEIGLPPHAYLLQVRIEQAKRMLLSGTSITDVALDTGFADQSHFTRHFKRSVGITPGQYCS